MRVSIYIHLREKFYAPLLEPASKGRQLVWRQSEQYLEVHTRILYVHVYVYFCVYLRIYSYYICTLSCADHWAPFSSATARSADIYI